jgi:hypothetical protein
MLKGGGRMAHPAPIIATLIAMYDDISLECLDHDREESRCETSCNAEGEAQALTGFPA